MTALVAVLRASVGAFRHRLRQFGLGRFCSHAPDFEPAAQRHPQLGLRDTIHFKSYGLKMRVAWEGSDAFGRWLARALAPLEFRIDLWPWNQGALPAGTIGVVVEDSELVERSLGDLQSTFPSQALALVRVLDASASAEDQGAARAAGSPEAELFVLRGPLEDVRLRAAVTHLVWLQRARQTACALSGPIPHDLLGIASVVAMVTELLEAEGKHSLATKLRASTTRLEGLSLELSDGLTAQLSPGPAQPPAHPHKADLAAAAQWFSAAHRGRELRLIGVPPEGATPHLRLMLQSMLDALARSSSRASSVTLRAKSERDLRSFDVEIDESALPSGHAARWDSGDFSFAADEGAGFRLSTVAVLAQQVGAAFWVDARGNRVTAHLELGPDSRS